MNPFQLAFHRVVQAFVARPKWTMLEEEGAQLILLDLMLPEMDGLELLRRIRQSERLKDIFVIIVSARIQERDIVQGLDLGADDYIIKPFSFHVLLARIRVGVRRMTPHS